MSSKEQFEMDGKQQEKSTVKRSSIFNEFFWICSGANRSILRQCPTEYSKYYGIGGTIFFTAVMAMLSGGYAFLTIFDNNSLAIIFGIFWGLLIFNLDRLIVNTMYSDGKYTISWGELGAGTPRLIIAVFIGVVISTPLELKIFEDEINVTIAELKDAKLREYVKDDTIFLNELEGKYDAENSKPTEDVIASTARIRSDRTYQELLDCKKELGLKNEEMQGYRVTLNSLDPVTDSLKYQRTKMLIFRLRPQIQELNTRHNQLESQLAAGNEEYKNASFAAKKKKDDELQRIREEIDALKAKINNAEKEYKTILDKEFGGFKTRMSAFNTMKKEDRTTWVTSLFITLLFVIIEVCPTFLKMMMASGPYDELLGAEIKIKKAQAIADVSNVNDTTNTQIKVSIAKNESKLEAEVAANKAILEKIAATQAELLDAAISEWRKNELAKIKEDPSQYIKSNTRKA